MKQRIFSRRWIILVSLLTVSLTFMFLQLLSLKALDNTLISRFRVLASLERLLLFQNHRKVFVKHLKIFTEVSREHGVPIFLFYPPLSNLLARNSTSFQSHESNDCELLCDHQLQGFTFGVISSEWQAEQNQPLVALISQFRSHLHSQGYLTACHSVEEPWFDSSEDFLNIKLIVSSCSISQGIYPIELLIFYDRKSYLWHGPLQGSKFLEFSGAYNRFSIEEKIIDGVHLKVPAEPDKLTAEKTQAQFKGCNLTNARQFYSKYGRDVSPDAVLFKRKAFEVLSSAVNALDRLDVRFWLSSGTCLGWFRQCDIIPHSKDVDLGIWIKDYNPLILSAFETIGLRLKHRFGRIEDSFELSFRTDEDFVKLDIFFFYEEKDYMWNGGTQARTGKKFKYTFPIFTLCWTDFLELKVRIPCETESYVMANYGSDWHVPIREWNWKKSPPNVRENGRWDEKDWGEVIQLF